MKIELTVFVAVSLFTKCPGTIRIGFGGHLITDFSQQTCIDKAKNGTTYYYWIDEGEKIPYCKSYNRQGHSGDPCPCPPGYQCRKVCRNTDKPCETDADCETRHLCTSSCTSTKESQCMAYHANTFEYEDNFYSAQMFKPKCTNDGKWTAKQCKGGLGGRCFCFDAKGNRLFGQAKFSDSKHMTCACSRRRADLLAEGKNYISFHCDSNGNFEDLQCSSGLCWCVEPQTGKLISPVVPHKAMTKLPCYKAVVIGGQYLRQCESIAYAMAYIEKTFKIHGMVYINMGNIQCDGDGAYGKYNLTGSIARCTWRDGKQIGSWQSDATTDISHLDCNCARDFKKYHHQLICHGTGNYLPLQTIINQGRTRYFCVDSDGFPKTDFSDTVINNCTTFY